MVSAFLSNQFHTSVMLEIVSTLREYSTEACDATSVKSSTLFYTTFVKDILSKLGVVSADACDVKP